VIPVDVTDATFEQEVVERSRELPVVVDFWADWCGPCHMLAPVLEGAVAARDGEVVLAKVDVDANPALSARFEVRGIPAVKAFRHGHVVAEFAGAQPPTAVASFLDGLTGPSRAEALVEELEAAGAFDGALEALRAGEHETALETIVAAAEAAPDREERDRIRAAAVAVFTELGQQHPLSLRYRRRLAAALN
jgi:putative thioredoxin